MTTTVSSTIGTGGTFSTPQTWEDAFPASLVTADEQQLGLLLDQNFTTSSGALLTFSGTTTDATRNIILQPNTGAGFGDNAGAQTNALRYNTANGASLSSTAAYVPVIVVSDDNVSLIGLQISRVSVGNNPAINGNAVSNLDINRCIVESTHGFTSIGVVLLFGSTQKIRNSLVVCRASSQACIAALKAGAQAYNCTFVVPINLTTASNIFNGAYAAAAVENCLMFGAPALNSGGTAPTCTTCLWNNGATTGIGFVPWTTATFVNITDATRDFRLVSGSGAIDAGTTDSTNAANDIVGTARPQGSSYDVGCWEFVTSGGGFFARPYYDMIGKAA